MDSTLNLLLAVMGGSLLGTVIGHFLRRQDDRIIIRAQSRTIENQLHTIQKLNLAIEEAEAYIRWLHTQVEKYIPKEEGGETPDAE